MCLCVRVSLSLCVCVLLTVGGGCTVALEDADERLTGREMKVLATMKGSTTLAAFNLYSQPCAVEVHVAWSD